MYQWDPEKERILELYTASFRAIVYTYFCDVPFELGTWL